ncbi:hypothetical protein DID88_005366 [Monilinia fructigena]|uniref:Uncharacterized protein n=1 Tax=Monilinia fructigena TaxID=38457 RepID=A0A395J0V8_9HELO|nr:hypothetical protein DID88_005366 [Monilinia fructigena]
MQKIEGGKPGKVYYPLEVITHTTPPLSPTSLLIQVHSTALKSPRPLPPPTPLPRSLLYNPHISRRMWNRLQKKATKLLKLGGTIVQYGMTISPKMDWSMPANLMNLELKGSTMGSRKEFKDMITFVNEHKIKPVVSRIRCEMEVSLAKLVIEVKSGSGEKK